MRKIIKTRGSFPNDDAALKLLYLAIKNAGLRWRRGVEWTAAMGSSPFSSARAFRDQRDDQNVDQPSYPAARVWPISKLCKGGPAAPACGGCGLDRVCCPATVSHHGIDDNVRLMQETTEISPSQRPLTQNI
ncbi:hypothetical protein [Bradyrhizobium sp. SRL28]|uniref:hypothetical protein n=1 Tax=Bradyrhizobium sp. SRL28 TaxID=2836178 RepID=UPI0035AE4BEC